MLSYDSYFALTSQELQQLLEFHVGAITLPVSQPDTTVTYAFVDSLNYIGAPEPSALPPDTPVSYVPLSDDERAFFEFYATYLSDHTSLTLQETNAQEADFVVVSHNMDGSVAGYATLPGGTEQQLLALNSNLNHTTAGDAVAGVLTHELAHIFGLDHPWTGEIATPTYQSLLPDDLQNTLFTAMTYSETLFAFGFNIPSVSYSTLQPLDVYALQQKYGDGSNVDNHTYIFDSSASFIPSWDENTLTINLGAPFNLVDTGGYDTVDFSSFDFQFQTGGLRFDFELGLTVPVEGQFAFTQYDANALSFGAFEEREDVRLLTIQPGTEIEQFIGSPDDDVVVLFDGDQEVIGGDGTDVVDLFVNDFDSTIVWRDDGLLLVTDRTGAGGTDAMTEVEALLFSNSGDLFDLAEFEDLFDLSQDDFIELAEMYVAYFNRAADAIGLYFWADKLAEGFTLNEIAEFFFDQDETRALYPNPEDTDLFVTAVYDNVLGRTPDAAGFEFWKGVVSRGEVTQGAFVLEIIKGAKAGTSAEDVAYLAQKAQLGVAYSAVNGLSDVGDAVNVMQVFGNQATSNLNGARAAIDGHFTDASQDVDGELIVQIVGVVDDPFAGLI